MLKTAVNVQYFEISLFFPQTNVSLIQEAKVGFRPVPEDE